MRKINFVILIFTILGYFFSKLTLENSYYFSNSSNNSFFIKTISLGYTVFLFLLLLNFSTNFYSTIFLFFFLLISFEDFWFNSFSTIFVFPLIFSVLLSSDSLFKEFSVEDYLIISLIILIFSIFSLKDKLGFGDIIIFAILLISSGIEVALNIILISCSFFITYYLVTKENSELPFLPFIFLAYVFYQFIFL